MEISLDKETAVLYVRRQPARECLRRIVRLAEDVTPDFTRGERPAGIEVLGAGRPFKIPR